MYLLDTNCLSELRRIRTGRADFNVAAWAALVPLSSMYLSAISIFEIQVGIARALVRDPVKADQLKIWLDEAVLPNFQGRIIVVDEKIASAAGPLAVARTSDTADVLIAATALVRRLKLVTRNTSDFIAMSVEVLNPWTPLSP